ncbi:MAG: GerMN domain-containing protein [Oscillospiraceae bacterium]|jgi:hypothetical protein|nr:GerMN domain-containing protein [Oscillospiraceae bacterium]
MRKILCGVAVLAASWALWPWLSQLMPSRLLTVSASPQETQVPVQPMAQLQQQDAQRVTLYFRYMRTGYLTQEERVLDVPRDQTVERCILEALLEGPGAGSLDLTPLFFGEVSVLGARRADDTLTVTLSDAFFLPPADAPADWGNYPYWQQEVPLRRRLALQAMVNALTEGGRFAKVELLVSTGPGDTHGQRVARAAFYPDEDDVTRILDPLTRAEDVILTPQRALTVALEAWQRKDWMTLYTFLRPGADALPSETDFIARMAGVEKSLLNYRVSTGTVSMDGAQATVCVDVQVMGKDGTLTDAKQRPMPLSRERGNWKVSYDTLRTLMDL